jgi:citrate lyase beta subunit
MDNRVRRSLLYVPASSEAMLRKAGQRGADVLVVDLEDGLHPEAKDRARAELPRRLREIDFGPSEVLLRVNGLATPWGEPDLELAAEERPAGVVLPKCEDPELVARADRRLGELPLFLMIETPTGVARAAELARAPRVRGLLFGAADFRAAMRASQDPDESELLVARSLIVLAARAAGIEAFDTPFFAYQDLPGLRRSAERARLLGFDGKTAIHPSQVAPIHEVFTPGEAEVLRARRVLAALEAAVRDGRGVATLDGEMLEALHGREAERTLARARVLAPA